MLHAVQNINWMSPSNDEWYLDTCTSAGFVGYHDGKLTCHGRSESIGIDSSPDDDQILNELPIMKFIQLDDKTHVLHSRELLQSQVFNAVRTIKVHTGIHWTRPYSRDELELYGAIAFNNHALPGVQNHNRGTITCTDPNFIEKLDL